MGLTSAYDELQKNQSGTLKGELATGAASGFLSAPKDGILARDWGAGEPVKAFFTVTAAAAWNPGTTGQVQIGVADDIVTQTNFTVLADSGTIAVAKLTAGAMFFIGYLKSGVSKRYLMAKWLAVGGNPTTGALVVSLADKNGMQQTYGDLTNSL